MFIIIFFKYNFIGNYIYRFVIWMHFKGKYWIIENMYLNIWYMPLSLYWYTQYYVMFVIWMYFKGEYWIIKNIYLKIWYMPLKPAINIHNIWMFPFAKPLIGLILYTCIYIHISIIPKKNGFELWIYNMSNRWNPKH